MNIDQLEAFVYISKIGNFSKAGKVLYISQPSISARIKTLENEVGYSLFHRKGKHITLTKEGEIFLPFAKTAWKNMQDGLLAIQQMNNHAEGEFSIATALTVSDCILPTLINEFHERYPKINLVVHTGHTDNVLRKVLNHEVPFGICRSVNHSQIETISLMDDEIVLAVYPEHPFSSRNTLSIQEVAEENLILFNRGSLDGSLVNTAFTNLGIMPNVILEVDNIELVKKMIQKQMGIGMLPKFSIQEEINANSLRVIPITNLSQISRPYELIYLKDLKINGMANIFINFLLQFFKIDIRK